MTKAWNVSYVDPDGMIEGKPPFTAFHAISTLRNSLISRHLDFAKHWEKINLFETQI